MSEARAVIIGAGPAGLTAAYELLRTTSVRPVVLEAAEHVGGISATLQFEGNRIDIGGHRFFSTSARVLDWWGQFLPRSGDPDADLACPAADPMAPDERRMLLRERRSHILFDGQMIPYPLRPDFATLQRLGWRRSLRLGASYAQSLLRPGHAPRTLEDFFVSRFGRALYETFFRSYTEKVWGLAPRELSADWGAQRVGGLSVGSALWQGVRELARPAPAFDPRTLRTLTNHFLYPKYGPGQLWQVVAEEVVRRGGEILLGRRAEALLGDDGRMRAVVARHGASSEEHAADYVISTMPVQALLQAISPGVPAAVAAIGQRLRYRSSIIVGLLLERLGPIAGREPIADQWLYIQEPGVKLGRVQLFNNWSRALVADPSRQWVGLEYFCGEGDELWSLSDRQLIELGVREGEAIGLLRPADLCDGVAIRYPKTYPVYADGYHQLGEVFDWLERYRNLYLVGRNGSHSYLNQDGAMLSAMGAVDAIRSERPAERPLCELVFDKGWLGQAPCRV